MKKFLFSSFRNNLTIIIGLGFFSMFSSVFSLVLPYFNGVFLDVILKKPDIKIIYNFALVLFLFGIISCIVNFFYSMSMTKVKNTIIYKCIFNIILHLRNVPVRSIDKYDPTYLNNRIVSDVSSIFEFFIENYASVFANGVSILLTLIFLLMIDNKLIVLILIFIPLYIVLFLLMKNPLFKIGIKFKEQRNIFYSNLNEQYSINEFIKINANFSFWNNYLISLVKNYITDVLKYNKTIYLFSSADSILSLLYTVTTLIVGGTSIINKTMSIGEFTIINAYLNLIQKNIRYFLNLGKGYQDAYAAYIRIKELLDLQEETNGYIIKNEISCIKVNRLEHLFLKNKANVFFEKNKIYGLIGDNGVGKTSLLKLLIGVFSDNTSGNIEYDGIDIKQFNMYEMRNKYDGNTPKRIDTIVCSVQHDENISQDKIYKDIFKYVIEDIIPEGLMDDNTNVYVNPTGRFVIGGPHGDSGVTGRKIIVDTYGGCAHHGGGAFSGKDCTKVDRSAAYMARYLAKNIVALGLAEKCEVQLSYAIGIANPVSVNVNTFGTGKKDDELLAEFIYNNFDLTPSGIIDIFKLRRPIYEQVASYGHFGRTELNLPWEQLDTKKFLGILEV